MSNYPNVSPKGDEQQNDVIKIVQDNRDLVLMHTDTCEIWKLEHSACINCTSELGCAKVQKLLSLYNTLNNYKPKNFKEYLEMVNFSDAKTAKILACHSVTEITQMPRL